MAAHPDSWVDEHDMSRIIPGYRKSFLFEDDYIDSFHRSIAVDPGAILYDGPIEGSLRLADALKLYELAYFSTGDILELGSFHGLSAWIMANALQNAGSRCRITSIDLSANLSEISRDNLARHGLERYATFVTAEGAEGIRQLAALGSKFGFAFIDHSHAMEHVLSACLELPSVMLTGSPVAFHDFNDRRNADPAQPEYGVTEGVRRAQERVRLEFRGVYGCIGLFQFYA